MAAKADPIIFSGTPTQFSTRDEGSFSFMNLIRKIKNFILWFFSLFFGSTTESSKETSSFSSSSKTTYRNSFPKASFDPQKKNHPLSTQVSSKTLDVIQAHKNGDGGGVGLAKLKKFTPKKIHESHFDWWLFPIDRSSNGYGDRFNLKEENFRGLINNDSFMKDYVEGIRRVLWGWGWDLDKNQVIISSDFPDQKWDGYAIRLIKMANSLLLFIQYAEKEGKRGLVTNLKKQYASIQLFYQNVVKPSRLLGSFGEQQLLKDYCSRRIR
jgi:hypothetical protein